MRSLIVLDLESSVFKLESSVVELVSSVIEFESSSIQIGRYCNRLFLLEMMNKSRILFDDIFSF